MDASRRNQIVLGALVIVLAVVMYAEWPSTTAIGTARSNVARDNRAAGQGTGAAAPDVHLQALDSERPKPSDGDRNLFRFKPKPVPKVAAPVQRLPPPPPPGPPPAPLVPPIDLKFMGIVEAPQRGLKVAALSDPYGVYYGREGDTILGQYKILRIGAESIDIAYLDGRGRQTIRLSGS